MKNTTIVKIIKVLSGLVRQPVQEMLKEGFFNGIDIMPIGVWRCRFTTRIVGRKWLAPLYRPVLGSFTIKPGTFLYVRENTRSCDIEYHDTSAGESAVYSVSAQEWREKRHYFEMLPPNKFRGSLGSVVSQIIQLRRSNAHKQREVSTRIASSIVPSDS